MNRNNPQKLYTYIVVIVALFFAISCMFRFMFTPNDDIQGGLRGNTFFIVRIPSDDGIIRQLWINENGTATRGRIGYTPRNDVKLTSTDMEAVLNIRTSWCVATPHFNSTDAFSKPYEIGILCRQPTVSSVMTKKFLVPADQLPAIIKHILDITPEPNNYIKLSMRLTTIQKVCTKN